MEELTARAQTGYACELPGFGIRFDNFVPVMQRAVSTGWVTPADAAFVYDGLRDGFKLGVDIARLHGHRWFKNYESALGAEDAVAKALSKRVAAGKTLDLGEWDAGLANELRAGCPSSIIFPVGAVPKGPLEPGAYRPVSDHSRSGLNGAVDEAEMEALRHQVNSYSEVAWFLRQDYFMRVSDVDSAFSLLPIHWSLWPFFLCRFRLRVGGDVRLLMHVGGDFGAAGMPGTFKRFFVDVVVQMARSVQVLTLPMPVHVDDCGLIGPEQGAVDREMLAFHVWAEEVCGIVFKAIKDRPAAQLQFFLGFWWCARSQTRTLDWARVVLYDDMLRVMLSQSSLTLREMQVAAGRIMRCIMTFPPGAGILVAGLFALTVGLTLPWHRRRLPHKVKEDLRVVRRLLSCNHGCGFYSFNMLPRAPEVRSDACKGSDYAGCGFVSACGWYGLWRYGSSAARSFIDYLEGDAVTLAGERLGALWSGCVVPFGVDNTAFQQSGVKGRSRAERLNQILYHCFVLQLKFRFVFSFFWLSTTANTLADLLSRGRELEFLATVAGSGFLRPGAVARRIENTGGVRQLPERRPGAVDAGHENLGREERPARGGRRARAAGLGALGSTRIALCLFGICAVGTTEAVASGEASQGPVTSIGAVSVAVAMIVLGASISLICIYAGAALAFAARSEPERYRAGRVGACEPRRVCPRARAGRHQGRATASAPPRPAQAPRGRRRRAMGTAVLSVCLPGGGAVSLHDQIHYARSSVWSGLPADLVRPVERVLDNRLAPSSWRTVNSGKRIWAAVAAERGWNTIIRTDDPLRGGKLTAFVMQMVENTELGYASIEKYAWGMRTFQQLHHQADPIIGVIGWATFMAAVKVLTWVAGVPRREVPLSVLKECIRVARRDCFEDVQTVFLIITLTNTFSRSESGLPKTYGGREQFDPKDHWGVRDFDVSFVDGLRGMWVRFRKIKQDQLQERPEAREGADWSFVGDVPDPEYSIVTWFVRLMQFHIRRPHTPGQPRPPTECFFLEDLDRRRPLIYNVALGRFKDLQLRAGVPEDDLYAFHGLRVRGYNGTVWKLGEAVAQAHGLWKSEAHKRYRRFKMSLVARIPAAIWELVEGEEDDADEGGDGADDQEPDPQPRAAPVVRATRATLRTTGDDAAQRAASAPPVRPPPPPVVAVEGMAEGEPLRMDDILLPPGWSSSSEGGFVGPDGQQAPSRDAAWGAVIGSVVESSAAAIQRALRQDS